MWGYETYDEDANIRRFGAFTKNDCQKLQCLQNRVMCLKSGSDYQTPTAVLLEKTKDMSVHQQISYHTLLSVFKVISTKKPTYVYERLKPANNFRGTRNGLTLNCHGDLAVTRGSFMYRGAKLFNMLPKEIKTTSKYDSFKRKVKPWILSLIHI